MAVVDACGHDSSDPGLQIPLQAGMREGAHSPPMESAWLIFSWWKPRAIATTIEHVTTLQVRIAPTSLHLAKKGHDRRPLLHGHPQNDCSLLGVPSHEDTSPPGLRDNGVAVNECTSGFVHQPALKSSHWCQWGL